MAYGLFKDGKVSRGLGWWGRGGILGGVGRRGLYEVGEGLVVSEWCWRWFVILCYN